MKGKIKEVKDLAGSVNKARQRIQYLKATIEQVRVEQAVHVRSVGGNGGEGVESRDGDTR